MNLRPGMLFKNIKRNCQKWSTLVVDSVDADRSTLVGTKRGSKTRWHVTVGTANLEEAARQAGWTEPPDVNNAWGAANEVSSPLIFG